MGQWVEQWRLGRGDAQGLGPVGAPGKITQDNVLSKEDKWAKS